MILHHGWRFGRWLVGVVIPESDAWSVGIEFSRYPSSLHLSVHLLVGLYVERSIRP